VPPSQRLGRAVPPDLEALILACLAKRREDRPASAQAMREALLACADAGKYDVAAARAWWTDGGATLRARSKARQAGAHGATMAIDFSRRGAGDQG
jgi:hypothetical protein